jgi:hypothetical protein
MLSSRHGGGGVFDAMKKFLHNHSSIMVSLAGRYSHKKLYLMVVSLMIGDLQQRPHWVY